MKVIVTGASKGIGRGIATHLASEGFELGLVARTSDELEALCGQLSRQSKCHYAACDVRDEPAVTNAIGKLANGMGGVDALINNAGVVIRKSVYDVTLEEWHALIDTNVHGVFYATRAVLPRMKQQRHGHIINISSISGKVPLPGGSAYAASKFAVTGFSQSLFQEVRDDGINVSVIYPGSVDSASHRHDQEDETSWKVQPEEVGRLCAHILRYPAGTCVSEAEIRPRNKPSK
ncbi:MAG: SDR family NAD(P)-dependent oxidoreductase [Candidatus Hydrogenedentales bacterium]